MNKRIILFALVAALFVSCTTAKTSGASEVSIIYTNDVHTYINNMVKVDGNYVSGLRFSKIAGLVKDMKNEGKEVILVDAGDAVARGFITGGGTFNVAEFFMRLNIVGVGRFTISLYGEASRGIKRHSLKEEVVVLRREKIIVADYVEGLKFLAEVYDDKELLLFTQELKESNMYIKAFEKSTLLAEKRNVPKDQILRNKADIDSYFKGGNA